MTKEALLKENADLKQIIQQQQAEINQLKQQLNEVLNKKKELPAFVKANKPKKKEEKRRKKRASQHNKSRRREIPTKTEIHRLHDCPKCGTSLSKHKQRYSRQVIEIPEPQPVEIVEHIIEKGWCEACHKWHYPEKMWSEQIGQGRFGPRLTGMVGYMRSVLRLPIRQIQAFLHALLRCEVSVGTIVNLTNKVGQCFGDQTNTLLEQVRGSPIGQMDETGWREDGQNGYIWCFVTDTPEPVRYFEYHQSRAGKVAEQMLGDFSGVLSSDFYAAYNIYEKQHQRCWVHLLRDLAKLRDENQNDVAIVTWCTGVKNLYHEGRLTAQSDLVLDEKQVIASRLIEMTRQFGVMYAGHKKHPCRALAKRLTRHMDELFLFVTIDGLSADNNLAERALRPLVVQRKISGGSRSTQGSATQMRLATVFQTWQARGLNPLHECWRLFDIAPSFTIS